MKDDHIDPDEKVWACPECKSSDVMDQMWVHCNTGEVRDTCDRYRWCNACDSELKGLDQIPRRETLEWQEEHEAAKT